MFSGHYNNKIAVHNCKMIQSLCCLEVHKLPDTNLPDLFFFLNLPTVIYSHQSHGSSTTQCSCLISDSVNPLRLMSHEFTLLTPLHPSLASRSPFLPQFLHRYYSKSHKGTQGRKRLQYKRPFSACRGFLEHSRQSQAFRSLLQIFRSTDHKHNNLEMQDCGQLTIQNHRVLKQTLTPFRLTKRCGLDRVLTDNSTASKHKVLE